MKYPLLLLEAICWALLLFFVDVLIPVIAPVLFEGMYHWNEADLIFCFSVEYAFLIVLIELREHLVKKAIRWLQQLSKRYIRIVLLLSNVLAYGLLLYTAITLMEHISKWTVLVFIQWCTLLVFIWAFCGVAIPMSAKRYWGWFRKPVLLDEGWRKGMLSHPKNHNKSTFDTKQLNTLEDEDK
ncbi:MAG: hypothetical protein U1C70_05405 [Sediminibacterium sp.]|uniref:hypothetical protein n=1 Tax=Sediminibacterium sp. TaxID=1917865 RepID=UPI002ABC798D|nr:hypothetical protein [Sediminibacterium sp.]MDZ4071243.1 hypothetical protein [Sediminibacterium sp.]